MSLTANQHAPFAESPYVGYVYGYPHKTAYRPFNEPKQLSDAWANEDRRSLFLYMHIPFCEQRCGFCNLFTAVDHEHTRAKRYVDTVRRHAERTMAAIGSDARFTRVAIGGGTPTILDIDELAQVIDIIEQVMDVDLHAIPIGIEASPLTASRDRLALLRSRGIDRLSIGVQSFDADESKRLGRTQATSAVHSALQAIRDEKLPTLNIDLIYGGDGQTHDRWLASIEAALQYRPEELYLYPLYVRPLTGLGRMAKAWDDHRLALYRAGRDHLLESGYEQVSMRMFRRGDSTSVDGPVYCCQTAGMVGVGCGARSYTRDLHYSLDYAVRRQNILGIIDNYMQRHTDSFDQIEYGFELNRDERKRRHVLMSLLQAEGLSSSAYEATFDSKAIDDLPQLVELMDTGMATQSDECIRLTPAGLERSDAIGPWLYSNAVRSKMESFTWR